MGQWIKLAVLVCCGVLATKSARGEDTEFFEQRIRPVLVEHCYECHNSADMQEGGLVVDHRSALIAGGDNGAAVVPGKPEESLLLAVMRHEIPGLEMPEGGDQLDAEVIEDFRRWIAEGAVDPRDAPPTAEDLGQALSWDKVFAKRSEWWSLQPLQTVDPPAVESADGVVAEHPVDRFLNVRLREEGVEPAGRAAPDVLVRRAYLALVGLPPTPEEAETWTTRLREASAEQRDAVWDALVDTLLASPHYGERWARHWMDWIRYAESHGSEGDPEITEAWRYRDYLIRALNADVPYDRLVREHIAGDLLEQPRLSADRRTNESAIGAAHWRMVFHGFAPTDALDERVRFTDDQISAFSKAFLGLTVACARCHDHKFDAISQRDYYALFGILAACRPGRTIIDAETLDPELRDALRETEGEVRTRLWEAWRGIPSEATRQWVRQVLDAGEPARRSALGRGLLAMRGNGDADNREVASRWQAHAARQQDKQQRWQAVRDDLAVRHWDLSRNSESADWYRHGNGLTASHRNESGAESGTENAGWVSLAPAGESPVRGLYPGGVYTHRISDKQAGRFTSPDVDLDDEYQLWVLARGDGNATLRYVIQDYPRNGTVYPVRNLTDRWEWVRFDLSYWRGDQMHVELATAKDAPLMTGSADRSWFGVREVLVVPKDVAYPGEADLAWQAVLEHAAGSVPETFDEVNEIVHGALEGALVAMARGEATAAQVELLDEARGMGWTAVADLSETSEAGRTLADWLRRYRQAEQAIPVPRRVPGLDDTPSDGHPLFVRGDHRQPAEIVPARFLSVFGGDPYFGGKRPRLRLAEDVLAAETPITRRVIVNRIWHHLFGAGLVRTPDNFGRLGERPTHPELMDWLARHFETEGWSIKQLIRLLVTSDAWQRDVRPNALAAEQDPENRLWSHANVRRLEAEVIRDAMLQLSGRLDRTVGGPPVGMNTPRRSIYLRVRRNALPEFLRAFDFPEPFSCVGRRDVTNVPAQSLALMNGDLAIATAGQWAFRTLENLQSPAGDPNEADVSARDTEGLRAMMLSLVSRAATPSELEALRSHLAEVRERIAAQQEKTERVRAELAAVESKLEGILAPVRAELLKALRGGASPAVSESLPAPVVAWDFASPQPIEATKGLELRGGATVEGGRLIVDGNGYAVSDPLPIKLTAKTLSAWVRLSTLDQRGGGVLSVQTSNGVLFDAIVFGEQEPRRWLSGSNVFARTQSFGGIDETEAVERPVHIVLTYGADGTITGYRNGKVYGKAYVSSGPLAFSAGDSVVTLGLRHLPAGGNRFLRGEVFAASVFDRALTEAQVVALQETSEYGVTRERVVASLPEVERQRVETLLEGQRELERKWRDLSAFAVDDVEVAVWEEVAHTLLMMKEFIYVR